MPKTFRCGICGKVLTRSTVLLDHMRGVHWGQKPHGCKHTGCGTSFTRRPDLLQHEKLHTDSPVYTCRHVAMNGSQYGCAKTFSRERDLVRHRNRLTGLKCRPPQSPQQDATELTMHAERFSDASVHRQSVQSLVPQNATEEVNLGLGGALAGTADILTSEFKHLLQETDTEQHPEELAAQFQARPIRDVTTSNVNTDRGASSCGDIGDPGYGPCSWYDDLWALPAKRRFYPEPLKIRCKDSGHSYGLLSDRKFKYLMSSLWHQKQTVGIPNVLDLQRLLNSGVDFDDQHLHPCLRQLFRLEQLVSPDTKFEQTEIPPVTTTECPDGSVHFTFRSANIDTVIDELVFAQLNVYEVNYRRLGERFWKVMHASQSERLDASIQYNEYQGWTIYHDNECLTVDAGMKGKISGLNMRGVYRRLHCFTDGFLREGILQVLTYMAKFGPLVSRGRSDTGLST